MILTRVDEGARIVLKLLVRGRMVENYLQLTGLGGVLLYLQLTSVTTEPTD